MQPVKFALQLLLSAIMIFAGVMHFVQPGPFVRIVPPYLPAPYALVLISGVFEVLGGVGLCIPAVRPWAAWGLIALYIAVFPANVHMALQGIPFGKGPTPAWALWARLPLQAVLIAWAYWYT